MTGLVRPRAGGPIASGGYWRTSGQLGIGRSVLTPRKADRAENVQCPHGREVVGQHGVRNRRGNRTAQIAVIACVGRRKRALIGGLVGRRTGPAMADDRKWVDGRDRHKRGGGDPQHGVQGDRVSRHHAQNPFGT